MAFCRSHRVVRTFKLLGGVSALALSALGGTISAEAADSLQVREALLAAKTGQSNTSLRLGMSAAGNMSTAGEIVGGHPVRFGGVDVRVRPSILIDDSLGTPESILDSDNTFESVVGLAMFDLTTGTITGFCSGTLINARTVITAAHCVRPEGTDPSFEQNLGVAVVFGPDGIADINAGDFVFSSSHVVPVEFDRDAFFLGHDVSVLALSERVTDIAPSGLVGAAPEIGTEVTLVGFGTTGTGDPAEAFFDFRRRAATNTLDAIDRFQGSPLENALLLTDFDDPDNPGAFDFFGTPSATALEGTTGEGDSGGALFVEGENGELLLAGLTSGGFNVFFDEINAIGDVAFFTNIEAVRPFIDAVNPLIETSAVAGDGDWLDPSHWTAGLIPDNFDPLLTLNDPTLPAAFFEVSLNQAGTTSLSGAGVMIDTLELSNGAALALQDAALETVDYVRVVDGNISLSNSALFSQRLFLQGGSVSIDADSLYLDTSPTISDGLVMTGGLLDIQGQFFTDLFLMDGGETRVSAGGILGDFGGSAIMSGSLTIDGELQSSAYLQAGGNVAIGSDGIAFDLGGVSTQLAGELRVNGDFRTGAFGFQGGILGGEGRLSAPMGVLQSGGMLDPGNSVGNFTIAGDLLQTAAATTLLEVNAEGESDFLHIVAVGGMGGNAVLDGEVLVDFANGAPIARGLEIDFVKADVSLASNATVMGRGRAADGTPTVLQAANEILLTGETTGALLVTALPYSDFATTEQQQAVAGALDAATTPTTVSSAGLGGVVGTLDTLGVAGALQTALQDMNPTNTFVFDRFGFQLGRVMANTLSQRAGVLRRGNHGGVDASGVNLERVQMAGLSPEDREIMALAANAQAAGDNSRSAGSNHGENATGGGHPWAGNQGLPADIGVFFAADVLTGDFDQPTREEDFTNFYLTLGVDKAIGDHALIGIAGTFGRSDLDSTAMIPEADMDAWGGSVYGSYFRGPFYFDGFASFFGIDIDSRRNIRAGQTLLATADGDADQFSGGFKTGAQFAFDAITLGPLVALRHTNMDLDRIEESGADGFGAIIDGRKAKETVLDLGGRVSADVSGEAHRTSLFGELTWQNRIGGDDIFRTSARLVGDPSVSFAVPGVRVDDSYAAYSVGIQSRVADWVSLQFAFLSDFSRSDATERQFSFGAKIAF